MDELDRSTLAGADAGWPSRLVCRRLSIARRTLARSSAAVEWPRRGVRRRLHGRGAAVVRPSPGRCGHRSPYGDPLTSLDGQGPEAFSEAPSSHCPPFPGEDGTTDTHRHGRGSRRRLQGGRGRSPARPGRVRWWRSDGGRARAGTDARTGWAHPSRHAPHDAKLVPTAPSRPACGLGTGPHPWLGRLATLGRSRRVALGGTARGRPPVDDPSLGVVG